MDSLSLISNNNNKKTKEMNAKLKDLEKELWLRMRDAGQIVWITKDGKKIPINEMSLEHLVNTLNMLYRQAAHTALLYECGMDADNQ